MDPNSTAVTVTLERFHCYAQEDGEPPIVDIEDDEPYAIVLSVDGHGHAASPGLMVLPPAIGLFRVGPLESIDRDETKPAPPINVWNLSGSPAPLPDITRTAHFIVLLEHDNSDPEQVHTQARTILGASVVTAWTNAVARTDLDESARFESFLSDVRTAFEAAVDMARQVQVPGAVDPDDRIGLAQVLRFTTDDHNRVLRSEVPAIERTLHFEGDDASYDLTLALRLPAPQVTVTQPFAIANQDGRIELFAIATDGAVLHRWQTAPNGPFGAWDYLGGNVTQPFAIHNADGRIEVFAIGADGSALHRWQTAPNGPFSDWDVLG